MSRRSVNEGPVMITELPNKEHSVHSQSDKGDVDEEEEAKNKIFNVREAVPPTDYDAPYSSLPSNVVLNRVR